VAAGARTIMKNLGYIYGPQTLISAAPFEISYNGNIIPKQIFIFGENHYTAGCNREDAMDITFVDDAKKVQTGSNSEKWTLTFLMDYISKNTPKQLDVFIEYPFGARFDSTSTNSEMTRTARLYGDCIEGKSFSCEYDNVRAHAIDYRGKPDHIRGIYDVQWPNGVYTIKDIYEYLISIDFGTLNAEVVTFTPWDLLSKTEQTINEFDVPAPVRNRMIEILSDIYNADIMVAIIETYIFGNDDYAEDLSYMCDPKIEAKVDAFGTNMENSEYADGIIKFYHYCKQHFKVCRLIINNQSKTAKIVNGKITSRAASQLLKLKKQNVELKGTGTTADNVTVNAFFNVYDSLKLWWDKEAKYRILNGLYSYKNELKGGSGQNNGELLKISSILSDIPAIARMLRFKSNTAFMILGDEHRKNVVEFFEWVTHQRYSYQGLETGKCIALSPELHNYLENLELQSVQCGLCNNQARFKCGAHIDCNAEYCSYDCAIRAWNTEHKFRK